MPLLSERLMSNEEEIKTILREKILANTSQSDLARKMGVDRRLVSRQLSTAFNQTTINKLVEMLNVINIQVQVTFKDI